MRYEDIEGEYIHVQRMVQRDSKRVVDRTETATGNRKIPLTDEAMVLIRLAQETQNILGVEEDGYIFSVNGSPLTHSLVTELYEKYCRKIGTSQKSSHKARKTFISRLIAG